MGFISAQAFILKPSLANSPVTQFCLLFVALFSLNYFRGPLRGFLDSSFYRHLPRGPWGLPYLGYLPFTVGRGTQPYLALSKQADIFGDRFTVRTLINCSE